MNPFASRMFLVGLAWATTDARAATFCVDTSVELQQALTTAGSNNEADTIRVEAGVYAGTGSVAFSYTTAQNFGLTIAGGYLSGCGVQALDPGLTQLTGSDARQVLRLTGMAGSSGAQSISNLTIRDGLSSESGAGLRIGGVGGYTGSLSVSRVVFSRNVSTTIGGGLLVAADGGIVNVLNNLFLLNQCANTHCAFSATVNAPSPVGFRAYFGNNTIVGNRCTAGSTCSETGGRFGGSASAVFYNNVFAANTNGDLTLTNASGSSTELYNNNLVALSGTPPAVMSGNIAFANPQFVDLLNDDLRPTPTSPLRNAGISAFALLQIDLNAKPRVNDLVVDIGAYENDDGVFRDGFEILQ
jgi:hypothetical protein